MAQGWFQTIGTQQSDSTALTASTTATSILAGAARFALPAGYFDAPGKQLVINASGRISNIVTTPGTLTLDVRLGGVVAFNGGAMALNTTAKTNVSWMLWILLTCRSIGTGTGATLMGQGEFTSESVFGSAAGAANTAMLPASAPVVGTGFDSTGTLIVDLFGTWSLSNANSIQTHQYQLVSPNN